jgi:hypothetical protein
MTTVNTVAIHNGVIVMTEVLRCTVNIDNERDHGNLTSCVHFGVMYATETTCAVKDDNGVRTSSKMDDIVIHLDDIAIHNKRNG